MPTSDEQPDASPTAPHEVVTRAFGADNRTRLLDLYFKQAGPVTVANAWQHVYRLLLWIDRTTALAHCYESDKAQPGRPWYARSLAFHDWISAQMGVAPVALAEEIDWLFREAVKDLARRAVISRDVAYERQRAPYTKHAFPEPGEDPGLAAIIQEALGKWMSSEPPDDEMRALTRRIHVYLAQENKRKNLVGEGFEDVIAAVMRRLPFAKSIKVQTRVILHELPGFHPSPPTEKVKKVDLALIAGNTRTLVTAKWSIRADREEQFMSDFQAYERLESAGRDFGYVLITNEFDAARLRAACERRRQNAPLFTHVVHINPAAVEVVYRDGGAEGASAVRVHIKTTRLMSFQAWLKSIGGKR